jgi:hypothetical protein
MTLAHHLMGLSRAMLRQPVTIALELCTLVTC